MGSIVIEPITLEWESKSIKLQDIPQTVTHPAKEDVKLKLLGIVRFLGPDVGTHEVNYLVVGHNVCVSLRDHL